MFVFVVTIVFDMMIMNMIKTFIGIIAESRMPVTLLSHNKDAPVM